MSDEIVRVEGLNVVYPGRGGGKRRSDPVHAVRDVGFSIARGEALALVGQSGSGKSTVGKVLCKLMAPTSGTVRVQGTNIGDIRRREVADFRRKVQVVFQDPYESLDPRYSVAESVEEPLKALTRLSSVDRRSKVAEILRSVELDPVLMDRFPHEMSGGQRQRAAIARALVVEPRFVVLDEPVSMLDVSIQAGVLTLLRSLQAEFDISYLFITHDLAVARFMGDRVAVMNDGELVEIGSADTVVDSPQHAYTRLLLESVPIIRGLEI